MPLSTEASGVVFGTPQPVGLVIIDLLPKRRKMGEKKRRFFSFFRHVGSLRGTNLRLVMLTMAGEWFYEWFLL